MKNDLISRQAAIEAIKTSRFLVDAMEKIIRLPSAQPVGCNGCRYDWLVDPLCAKCARSFQDHYEERKEE